MVDERGVPLLLARPVLTGTHRHTPGWPTTMACQHSISTLRPPSLAQGVYKEECTLCFQSTDKPEGIDVCLSCFNGSCKNHSQLHAKKTGHQIVLNICRIPKPGREGEPPKKMTKLAVEVDDEALQFDYVTTPKCLPCNVSLDRTPLAEVIDGVIHALSAKKQSEVKAWEEETKPCSHTTSPLQQSAAHPIQSHCCDCNLQENLWLCLICGNLGCGRRQYDGSGGNNHAIEHFNTTQHPVCVKLGTITPEGTADLYCYAHDDAVLDPNLALHLKRWGIQVSDQQKTEKSMAELQLAQNLKFDFSMVTPDGTSLEPLSGPGLTGLKNLGNSCYMAAVLQSLLHIPALRDRYLELGETHVLSCTQPPASCLLCQMAKMADGLWSGRYADVTPSMLKQVIGKDHPEFSTMRQQDAGEFMDHLLQSLERREKVEGQDPTAQFKFTVEQRLQCQECHKVRYTQLKQPYIQLRVPAHLVPQSMDEYLPVTFEDCLKDYTEGEDLEYACPECKHQTMAKKTYKFITFPQVLAVWMYRFVQENWVPKKLNIAVQVPEDINLDYLRALGPEPGEEILPEDAPSAVQFDQASMDQLQAMGFPVIRCQKALLATGNAGPEVAMNWLFEHMDDPDIDNPLPAATSANGPSPHDVAQICDMGFTEAQAKRALDNTSNNVERAVDWLFNHPDDLDQPDQTTTTEAGSSNYALKSFISHKGTSVHCGHYVAHIKQEDKWVLYNDEKVVHAVKPPFQEAYIYIFQNQ